MYCLLDKIIIVVLIIWFIYGWLTGVMRSLIGPFSFLFCLLFSFIFFDLNTNILISFAILFLGSILLAVGLNALTTIATLNINKEYRGKTHYLSRILGGAITTAWYGNLLFICLLLVLLIPTQQPKLQALQEQIDKSKYVHLYYAKIIIPNPRLEAIYTTMGSWQDSNMQEWIKNTPEYKSLVNNQVVWSFINDPEIQKAFDNKDYLQILKHPHWYTLINDNGAMSLFSKTIKVVYEKNLSSSHAASDKDSSSTSN